MKFPLLASIYILIVLTLTGCDDSSSSIRGLEVIDTAPPEFTSGMAASASENSISTNYIVTASDVDDGQFLDFSITGGSDMDTFTLDENTGALSFISPPNFEVPTDTGGDNNYEVEFTVTDGHSYVVQTVIVTVSNEIGEAPFFTSPVSSSVSENIISDVYIPAVTDEDGDSLTFSLSGESDQGLFDIDANSGAISFFAAPNFEAPSDSDLNNSYVVEITVTDGMFPVSQTVTINVSDVQEPPEFTSGTSISVNENIMATGYTATATDEEGAVLVYSLIGGSDLGAFSIDDLSGVLRFEAPPNFETPADSDFNNSYGVDISVSDGQNSVIQQVTVTVLNVNDNGPEFTSGNAISVDENISDTGYTATAMDADGSTLSFSLSDGSELNAFSIDSVSGELSFKDAPDYEFPSDNGNDNTYVVDITVTDGVSPATQTVTVTVLNTNDNIPEFTSGSAVSVNENIIATGYTAMATDDDGNALTFSIDNGIDKDEFSIDAVSGVLSFVVAPDYENPSDSGSNNTYVLNISVTDGLTSVVRTVTVTVLNVNDNGPVFSSGTAISVDENIMATGYIATATDDDGNALTFSISSGIDKDAFSIDAVSGELSFKDAPDYEFPSDDGKDNTYVVGITVSDGLSQDTQTVTVSVNNINDTAPEFESATTISVNENTTVTGYTAVATDVEGQTPSFSLSGGSELDAFSINPVSGVLSFKAPPDFETPNDDGTNNTYQLEIPPSAGTNDTAQTLTVTVLDVLEISASVAGIKTIQFDWSAYAGSSFYRLLVDPTGSSGYSMILDNITGASTTLEMSVYMTDWVNATYMLEAHDGGGTLATSNVVGISAFENSMPGYFKASNTGAADEFGFSVSLSGDGHTMAVGAPYENGNAGAVYVFIYNGSTWVQEEYLKASDAAANDNFGFSVVLSEDGNILAVGANGATSNTGAVYVNSRSGSTWTQESVITASNAAGSDEFGFSLSLSDDGNSLVVGAIGEDSDANAITTDGTGEGDNSAGSAGAAYMFLRSGGSWPQQAYVKASNSDPSDQFGWAVSLSGDGNTLAVGANKEGSEGAAYVFVFSGGIWTQQARLQATDEESNSGDEFGFSLSLSDDGNTLAVGAPYEGDDRILFPDRLYGQIYVFSRIGSAWTENANERASDKENGAEFGFSLSLSGDGQTLVVGAPGEASDAGRAYLFSRSGNAWTEDVLNSVNASNKSGNDGYGFAVSMSDDGSTFAVGATGEDSNATGTSNDGTGEGDNSASRAGAVYMY